MNIKLGAVPPQQGHLLGTDHLGRDVAAGIVGGAAVAMKVGLLSTFFAAITGLLLGGWAGFRGGRRGGWRDPDSWLMRVLEIYQSLPTLLVLLVLAGLVGRMNELRISLIIAMLEWPAFARLARTEMRRVREMSYIEAARSLGLGSFRTWWRHALPNSVAPILVLSAFAVAVAVLLEASLSFLGIGLPPEQVSWGSMMGLVRHHPNMWWLALAPGLVLSVVLLALSVAGEALRQRRERR
jgi:peptide/nickel transport system permease protein